MLKARSPWQVTRAVWYAMFMRELVARTMADRMAWFWMVFEPIAIVAVLVTVRTVIMSRERLIQNAEFIPWLVIGLMGFFLFRENMFRLMGAVDANKALYAYRQVKPIDGVLVRSLVESLLRSFIFLLFISAGLLLGMRMNPDNALLAIWVWISLWLLGLGAGLVLSVVSPLVPEIGKIIRIMSLPLLLLSGVIIPISILPHHLQYYILLNPIPHGIEYLRQSFFSHYPLVNGVDLNYLWFWSLSMLALGLLMHIRFEYKLKSL